MTRTPTPAQRAARERFAEMARSGAFARKAKRNPARKKAALSLSPETTVYKRYSIVSPASSDTVYIVRGGTNIGSARSIAEAKKIIDMLTEGVDNPRASNPVLLIRDIGSSSKKRQRNPAKKLKMLNISWMTPGGAREFKSVPIEFTFTHRVGNDPFRFFVRKENNFLVVSEYSTGGRIGQVPYAMRAAASDDRAAAKQFVGEMLSRVGEYRFRAAVAQFTPIN